MHTISKIPKEGITSVRKVLCYFNGQFPKKAYPLKDVSLPRRLFPNAKYFVIRCKPSMENIKFFTSLYAGTNAMGEEVDIKFISDIFKNWDGASAGTDAMYMPWIGFDGYQDSLAQYKVDFHWAIQNYKKPIYMFMNEPSMGSYKSMRDYALEKGKLEQYRQFFDIAENFSHVHFMPNDTPFSSTDFWWEPKIKHVEKFDPTVSPIPDNIIYALPTGEELMKKFEHRAPESYQQRGVWIGTCFEARAKYLNSLFTKPGYFDFDIKGRGTDNVNLYTDKSLTDTNVDNHLLPGIYAEHDYSIYFARAKFMNMLGATFYEPILNGIPQFIDELVDPKHEIFPHIPECYYNSEESLQKCIQNVNLKELWLTQVNQLLV